jgi:hypothetical protein
MHLSRAATADLTVLYETRSDKLKHAARFNIPAAELLGHLVLSPCRWAGLCFVTLLTSGVKYIPVPKQPVFLRIVAMGGLSTNRRVFFSLLVGSRLEDSHRRWHFCSIHFHFRNWPLIPVLPATVASVGSLPVLSNELSGRILLLESPGAPGDILLCAIDRLLKARQLGFFPFKNAHVDFPCVKSSYRMAHLAAAVLH